MQTIHLGTCITKPAEISLETLISTCLEVLDETEKIKKQFRDEYHL